MENTANPVPRESLRYTVVSRPMNVVMNDLSYPFEWFTRAAVLNCEIERVICDVDQPPPRLILSERLRTERGLGDELKLTTSPTKNVLEVSP